MIPTWGERSGEEGAGEEDETPESPPAAAAIEVAARCGSRPYLAVQVVSGLWPMWK